ncbi:sensor histidine kinase [Alkalicoccus chagannorensis]|uniref:sensor histidine kinase n=1 Tax=Alkalicoccus chagannorensis TaxID=427072 RepID=UPI00040CC9D5|nr:HAMP domain-containing sensor histidine kinase [Alkalicoccus chagannorensis]
MNVTTKISIMTGVMMLVIIAVLAGSYYAASTSFYEEQTFSDLESRLAAHADVIDQNFHPGTFNHILTMEEREEGVNYVEFDMDLHPVRISDGADEHEIAAYQAWIQSHSPSEVAYSPGGDRIFAVSPFAENGETAGYLFIDQSMQPLADTTAALFRLTLAAAGGSLLLGALFLLFLHRRVHRPLRELADSTAHIADGHWGETLDWRRQDELGLLSSRIDEMSSQLAAYQQSRKQLLSSISHDLRTPLTYVKAYASLLQDQPQAPEEANRQISVIHREAVRMERLVEDLVELTNMEEGKRSLRLENLDLSDAVQQFCNNYQAAAEAEHCTLSFSRSSQQLHVHLDQDRLEQALYNLLRNAVLYTGPGCRIHLHVYQEDKTAVLVFDDNGPGIPASQLSSIWDRFYRGDDARSSKTPGSGLGLSIVKQLIHLHDGDIQAENRPEGGLRFLITLPLINRTSQRPAD